MPEISAERARENLGAVLRLGGIEKFKSEKPDLVLLDLRLPGMGGVECLRELKKIDSKVKVIIVTIVMSIVPP
mgnify:CR=1 FL=1